MTASSRTTMALNQVEGKAGVGLVPVVRHEFCAHDGMELILSKVEAWSWGNYTVTDGVGNFLITVEGRLSLRWTRTLLDSSGTRILKIHKKFMNPSIFDAFIDGEDGARRVFTVQSSLEAPASRFSLKVFLPVKGSEPDLSMDPDFKLEGAYFQNDYGIDCGERSIAQASRKPDASSFVLGCGAYTVTVFPGVDHVFVVALVLIMDELHLEASVGHDST
ncbi:hypothetical protein SELMODRAFT_411586 [Selaginella moellendorffii]|uniref:Tubby C-terminal domain-containing protein n=2 Tax=Selaginella moellendorffii TaxID=88036 RepID=D8RIE3_SELML|nr:hypothetical protein SELMODRAFT_411586 [Selaginella moellendorffii]